MANIIRLFRVSYTGSIPYTFVEAVSEAERYFVWIFYCWV